MFTLGMPSVNTDLLIICLKRWKKSKDMATLQEKEVSLVYSFLSANKRTRWSATDSHDLAFSALGLMRDLEDWEASISIWENRVIWARGERLKPHWRDYTCPCTPVIAHHWQEAAKPVFIPAAWTWRGRGPIRVAEERLLLLSDFFKTEYTCLDITPCRDVHWFDTVAINELD